MSNYGFAMRRVGEHVSLSFQATHVPKMDSHDGIPLGFNHSSEALIPQDTSIGNEDMNPTELLEGDLDDGFTILSRVDSGRGLSTSYIVTISPNSGEEMPN